MDHSGPPGSSSQSVSAAYDAWAAQYDHDRNLTRDLDHEVLPRILQSLPRPSRTIETGCGTGKNTGYLASASDEVLALDFSAGMLAKAKARVSASNVTFLTADLTSRWPVEDSSAALVCCNLVLEHIETLPAYFVEAARVLQPGGHLYVCELHPYKQYAGSQARFEAVDGSVVRIPAFVHHVSEFTGTAIAAGFTLQRLDEWWHPTEPHGMPRLLSLLFRRA